METKSVQNVRFSPSKLNTCYIKYYLSYIEPLKFITINYPILLGKIVHSILEDYVEQKYVYNSFNEENFKTRWNNIEKIKDLILKEEILRKTLYEEEFIKDEEIIEKLKEDLSSKELQKIFLQLQKEP